MLVQWRWYDGKPTMPLWIALLALLVVPRENRKWQAWLILALPLLVATLRWALPDDSAPADLMLQTIVTFAIAWASVWLIVPPLGCRSRLATFTASLAVMFGAGAIGYLSYFGLWLDPGTFIPMLILWVIGSALLLLALMISGACCRRRFHPRAVAFWLLLWLPLSILIAVLATVLSVGALVGGPPEMRDLLLIVPQSALMALMLSVLLYAVNLPIVFLAVVTDCYRERMQAMLCRRQAGENPFRQPPVVTQWPADV